MATSIAEIGPDIFRLCTYIAPADLQFCQFVVRDDDPLLFHCGMRALFPDVRNALERLLDPASLRWISFSHFEADESGALNDWLSIAPRAEAAASFLACVLDVEDFAIRPPRALADGESLSTGQRRFRFIQTPHVPHAWEAGLLYEETTGTLLSSDLLFQRGDPPALDSEDVLARCRETMIAEEQGPFSFSFPYTARTADPRSRGMVRACCDGGRRYCAK